MHNVKFLFYSDYLKILRIILSSLTLLIMFPYNPFSHVEHIVWTGHPLPPADHFSQFYTFYLQRETDRQTETKTETETERLLIQGFSLQVILIYYLLLWKGNKLRRKEAGIQSRSQYTRTETDTKIPQRTSVYWVCPCGMLNMFSYTTEKHWTRGCTAHLYALHTFLVVVTWADAILNIYVHSVAGLYLSNLFQYKRNRKPVIVHGKGRQS